MTHMSGKREVILETVLEARPKVFGIGFHKTGTTSLAHSLYTLGYLVGGHFNVADIPPGHTLQTHAIELAHHYDALQDMPWPVLYESLDATFPGSKFILTVRDPEAWLRSVITHFGKKVIPTSVEIYGVENAADHPQVYLDRYQQHTREVLDYFAGRPDDLLVMDFAEGAGWSDLCAFLGLPTPTFPVPRQNQRASLRQPTYLRLARRATGRVSREVNQRISPRRGIIDAPTAWTTVHEHCRRGDALFALYDQLDSAAARSAIHPVLAHLYARQVAHLAALGAGAGDAADRSSLDAEGALGQAWHHAALLTRHFAGNLDDEGCRAIVDGKRVSDVLKMMAQDGLLALGRATSALEDEGVMLKTNGMREHT